MIDTLIGPVAREELEILDEHEDLPQGNTCITRRYYLCGELVRQDVQINVTAEGLAALGFVIERRPTDAE